ncbi:MAG: response regulator transcription factor [Epsilonproteobacteria bacterium]|nr:response regulator transcription factor [Campylobacterota bacterium]
MKKTAKILILGDEEELLVLRKLHLLKDAFDVVEIQSITNIEQHLKKVHLLLIHREMKNMNGLNLTEYIREKGYDIPIIFLSDKASEDDIEQAFFSGVDDYLVKPFSIRELVCRIKALLRRTYGLKDESLSHRDITLDLNTRKCYIGTQEVELTKLEFDLLKFFIHNKNTILERDHILEKVWDDKNTKKRTINVRMNRLIKKIDANNTKKYFTAIRGIGYRFN